MTSKKDLISQLDGKTNFSKSTLSKMTLGELKSLVGDDKAVEKQKKQKEPVVVVAKTKPRRREPVLREFSDSEQDEKPDEQKEEQEKEQEQKEEVVEPEKEAEKPVVEQHQRGRPSNKNKIKAPKLSVEKQRDPTPPQSPQPKTLTTSELRKVLRADYFKGYESDVKEILLEYKQGDLTIDSVVSEYTLLRDDFLVKLNNFLDTQRKLSDVQLDYIDSLLQRVADRVESELG